MSVIEDPGPQPIDHERIVALVASAGGIDAVSRVLGPLPEGFAASVLVLIHQSPEHISRLVPILQRRCRLPVVAAHDGMRMRAGEVAVAMPGQHVLVTPDRRIATIASGPFPPSRPSADLLLTTLATALRSRAIAVVLSGGGHDGATGAVAVHAFGGTVLATDEASSSSFSMPLAAIERDAAVDEILPLDGVAAALERIVGVADAAADAHA